MLRLQLQPDYRYNAHAERSLTIVGNQLRDEVSITTTDGKQHALGFVLNLLGKSKIAGGFLPTISEFSNTCILMNLKYVGVDVKLQLKAEDKG